MLARQVAAASLLLLVFPPFPLGLGAVACRRGAAPNADAAAVDDGRQGVLRRAWPAEPTNLLPFLDPPDGYGKTIGGYLYEGLVTIDPQTGQPVPALAARINLSADGKTVTATLRPGVFFHDGSPVTVRDVLATFAAVRDPRNPTVAARERLADVEAIRSPALDTIEFAWKRPDFRVVRALADVVIIPERVTRAGLGTLEARRSAPGTGPFRLVEWKSGSELRFARNERYWGEAPRLAGMLLRIIRDPATQLAAFRRGDLDLVSLTPTAFAAEREALERDARWRTVRYARDRYDVVHLNVRRPPLSDVRVRRAIDHAVDRQAMTRAFHDGRYPPIRGPVLPVRGGFTGFEAPDAADPAASRRLLADAKVPPGTRLTLRTFAGPPELRQIAESIREQLARVGLTLIIAESDWPTLAADLEARRFDLAFVQEQASPDRLPLEPPDMTTGGYGPPDLALLVHQARGTLDDAARGELLQQVARAMAADVPAIYLWRYQVITLVRSDLRGVEPSALGGLDDVRRWSLPRESRPP